MKGKPKAPMMIFVVCVLLAGIWLIMALNSRTGILGVVFLPLTASPYILWVVHKEGQEPEGYLKETYGSDLMMWVARVFMMVVISALSSIIAITILGIAGLVFGLFK
jgi:hypothetical protein